MVQKNYKSLTDSEIAAFCSQMALVLHSGISAVEGISIMFDDAETTEERGILELISAAFIQSGYLSDALKAPRVFPEYMIKMVEIGEQSGRLDEVMSALADHYEREDGIAKEIKNAVTYPAIMIGMMLLIVLLLLTKILPIFNQVFIQLGHEMSGFSRSLLNLGSVISNYSMALVALLFAAVAGIYFMARTEKGKEMASSMGAKLGFSKNISDNIASCRFASGMALTLSSGLTSEQSFELAKELIQNPVFLKKLEYCKELTEQGVELSKACQQSGIFSGIYARIITIASKTGSIDEAMKKIAKQYEEEIDAKITNIISILEPTLVAAISIIVGMILLSVMLPLMAVLSSL